MSGLDMPKPKRVGPPAVEPVTVDGVRYEAPPWGRERGLDQNGGYVVATDASSGRELWKARIYRIDYDPKLESDVQDIFIKSIVLGADGRELVVTDERDRKFVLDLTTHDARPMH
jgi:hypothetical protein